jgi:hypothetical protein
MKTANLRNVMKDPRYRPLGQEDCERLGFGLHDVLYSKELNRLVVLLRKSKKGPDWSLNEEAKSAACRWQAGGAGRVAYIGLIDPDNPKQLLAWETAYNVRNNLNGADPVEGEWGLYFYITENFRVRERALKYSRNAWPTGTLTDTDDDDEGHGQYHPPRRRYRERPRADGGSDYDEE